MLLLIVIYIAGRTDANDTGDLSGKLAALVIIGDSPEPGGRFRFNPKAFIILRLVSSKKNPTAAVPAPIVNRPNESSFRFPAPFIRFI